MSAGIIREALFLVGLLSFLPLTIAACCGLCITLLQAVMQIQEQTVHYIVKTGVIAAVIYLFSQRAFEAMILFLQHTYGAFP